jgi:hypothetical protein
VLINKVTRLFISILLAVLYFVNISWFFNLIERWHEHVWVVALDQSVLAPIQPGADNQHPAEAYIGDFRDLYHSESNGSWIKSRIRFYCLKIIYMILFMF